MAGLAGHAAAAGIHRGDQLEARREGDAVVGAGDHRLAALERLAERIEHLRRELGQLVEKQDAVVGERGLAGPGADAAADHRRHRGGMVRRAERAGATVRRPFVELAGDRGDHRHFEQLARRERRQDRGQPARQHRLAGAGRADHQQVVAAGGGDLERALGGLLALDVGEVGQTPGRIRRCPARAATDLRAREMVGDGDQAPRREDRHVAARPGRLRPAGGRADQAAAEGVGGDRGRQHAARPGRSCRRARVRRARRNRASWSPGIAPSAAMSASAIGRS